MGWTSINDRPGRFAAYPNAVNVDVNSFHQTKNFYQPIHHYSPVSIIKPNGYSNLQNDLCDPLGNQSQLAQMIALIAQQLLHCFKFGGGNGSGGFHHPGYGFGGVNHVSAGYGGYSQFPNSYGGGYEGGARNFRPFGHTVNSRPIDTKGWWNDCFRDCNFGETFRRAKPEPRHREIECDRPPKHKEPRDCKPDHDREKPGKPVHGSVTGDPHFLGADGEKYDIKGKPGKIYNLIADKDMSVNARFAAFGNKGNTVMEALGFNFGKDKLSLDVKDGKSILRYNGADVDTSKNWSHDGYSWDAKKQQLNMKKKVEKEEWDLTANVRGKGKDAYLDLYINKGSKVDKNDTKTTGLWGDSISGKKEDVNKDGGAGVITGANGKPLDKKYDSNSAEHRKAMEAKEVQDLGSKKP